MASRISFLGVVLFVGLITISSISLAMEIRVLITCDSYGTLTHQEVQLQATREIMLVSYTDNLATDSVVTLQPTASGIKLLVGHTEQVMSSPIWIYPAVNDQIQITSITRGGEHPFTPSYRGFLEVHLIDGNLQIINQVPLEEYLYGVVPSEMPVTWPLEAIKAQAIASRTYVVGAILSSDDQAQYHVEDTVFSQVYNNQREAPIAREAVDLTRGLVMLDANTETLVRAYFHSTSGGITAAAGDVWGYARHSFPNNGVAYLQARPVLASKFDYNFQSDRQVREFLKDMDIPSYEQDSPWYRWKISLTFQEFEQIINANLARQYQLQPDFILTKQANGQFASRPVPVEGIGSLLEFKVVERGQGGNILAMEIHGTTGQYQIIKEFNIRSIIQPTNIHTSGSDIIIHRTTDQIKNYPILPSAFCDFEIANGQVVIYGGGNGHGVGMSQWGAKGMAEAGYNHLDILESFYTEIKLINIYQFADIKM